MAAYIPQLANVEPEQFGVSLCTIDGQRFSMGDSQAQFCIQSCCKPVNYCLALEEHGAEKVHQHIGCEPSGQSFNELTLNKKLRPHNPMINAGAIMCCSLLKPTAALADRFEHVHGTWSRLCAYNDLGYNNAVYLSERETADRNFALAYFMRESNAFPENTDIQKTLDFYFQCCSLQGSTEQLSTVAATLASGGVSPYTGERILAEDTVQKCLSLMYSCGMYDYSGEWAFIIGLPAKSGVSGLILIVVPNVMGIACWSPRLDQHGNSVRGIEFCKELVSTFNFHNYDNISGNNHHKTDPRKYKRQDDQQKLATLLWAAACGDVSCIQRLIARGVDLNVADYDKRTALHIAASEGQEEVVAYMLAHGAKADMKDRWERTALDDAKRTGNKQVMKTLECFK